MSVYGPNQATSGSTEGAPAWSNTPNGFATDGVYASYVGDGVGSGSILLTAYGFSIPAETITGIKATIIGHASGKGASLTAQLLGDGGEFGGSITYTAPVGFSFGATDSTVTLGGPGDTWGYAWVPGDIIATFGVIINAELATLDELYVDSAKITIYTNGSTDPSGGGPLFRRRRSFRGG